VHVKKKHLILINEDVLDIKKKASIYALSKIDGYLTMMIFMRYSIISFSLSTG